MFLTEYINVYKYLELYKYNSFVIFTFLSLYFAELKIMFERISLTLWMNC